MLASELIQATAFTTEGLLAPGQWSRADYLWALDSAIRDIAMFAEATRTWRAPQTVLNGASLLTLVPVPYRVLNVRYSVTKRLILPTSETLENAVNPAWRDTAGIPNGWMPESGNTLRLNGSAFRNTLNTTSKIKSRSISIISSPANG